MVRKLIAGNWKMNGNLASSAELAKDLVARAKVDPGPNCDFLVCPPAPLLTAVAGHLTGSAIALGGQDCHAAPSGAHTGDTSAALLKDVGCRYVILGHSERRSDHGETSAMVKAKAEAAIAAGLVPIVCVGETEQERVEGRALAVIEAQVNGSLPDGAGESLVVAYEPVWAIGTGRTATTDDVAEVHGHIRALLKAKLGEEKGAAVRILYGGSVKPDNAGSLMRVPDVDGALVGGASLKAEDFWAIGVTCPLRE